MGYVMRPGFDIPPSMFDRDEIAALVTGARLVEAWGGAAMARAASEALAKISAVVPADIGRAIYRTAIQAFPMPDLDAAARKRLDLLDGAIRHQTRLKLRYTDGAGSSTERHIRPLGLVFWGKVWTLIAWCEVRDDFRMFRVDRVMIADADGRFDLAAHQTLAAFYAREAGCALETRSTSAPAGDHPLKNASTATSG